MGPSFRSSSPPFGAVLCVPIRTALHASWARLGLAGLLALATTACSGAPPQAPEGVPAGAQALEVVRHVDGDTVAVRLSEDGPAGEGGEEVSVRLLEVDTPEVGRDGERDECFAREASARTAALLPVGSTAYGVPDRELRDRFGRTLLYLWTEVDGEVQFVNSELVAGGFARSVLFEPNDRFIEVLRADEARARSEGRGLWQACPFFGAPG